MKKFNHIFNLVDSNNNEDYLDLKWPRLGPIPRMDVLPFSRACVVADVSDAAYKSISDAWRLALALFTPGVSVDDLKLELRNFIEIM